MDSPGRGKENVTYQSPSFLYDPFPVPSLVDIDPRTVLVVLLDDNKAFSWFCWGALDHQQHTSSMYQDIGIPQHHNTPSTPLSFHRGTINGELFLTNLCSDNYDFSLTRKKDNFPLHTFCLLIILAVHNSFKSCKLAASWSLSSFVNGCSNGFSTAWNLLSVNYSSTRYLHHQDVIYYLWMQATNLKLFTLLSICSQYWFYQGIKSAYMIEMMKVETMIIDLIYEPLMGILYVPSIISSEGHINQIKGFLQQRNCHQDRNTYYIKVLNSF